jgi:two-component system, NarL family, response regulator NreC
VVVADNHASMRRTLRLLLDGEADVEVVAEAADFAAAARQVATQHPRVLVLDVRLPNGFGVEGIQQLRELAPGTEIVVVTMHENPTFAERALRAGALGLVLKDTAEVELAEAVRRAAGGLEYRSPRIRHSQSPGKN